MEPKRNQKHHFIVAHRDDAFLTFGGRILKARARGEEVNVYVVYGTDGYIEESFLKSLVQNPIENNSYLLGLANFIGETELDQVKQLLSQSDSNDVALGIAVRSMEEKAISKDSDVTLHEYNLPCGFPLRGYEHFNSSESKNDPLDQDHQIGLLFGEAEEKYIELIKSIGEKHGIAIDPVPVLRDILSEVKSTPDIEHHLYFLSGIGAHPDHRILAKCAEKAASYSLKNAHVYIGQDLPYSSVAEWWQYSPLNVDSYHKDIIDITDVLPRKLALLESYYKSQLSGEDVRIVGEYHKSVFNLMHRKFFAEELNNIFGNDLHGDHAVEIAYRLV